MNIKSESLYNTMCFLLTKHPDLTPDELIDKLKKFETIHLEKYKYSPFLFPTIVELKDLLDGRLNPEFMEITVHFKLSKDSIKAMFEPDMDVFSINQIELLKDL